MEYQNKHFFLSFLQCICAISVVTLHTNGIFWKFSQTERYWFTANIVESLFYFAVPIFFMITGATLLNYQERYSTKEYFVRRIKKTVFPYVCWSFIGILFLLAVHGINSKDVTFVWVINGLLSTNQIIGIYWFFAPLFCVYLSIPIFASIEKEKKKSVAAYVILLSLVVNITIPFTIQVLESNIVWKIRLLAASEYIFYIWGGVLPIFFFNIQKNKSIGIFCLYFWIIIAYGLHLPLIYDKWKNSFNIQRLFKFSLCLIFNWYFCIAKRCSF